MRRFMSAIFVLGFMATASCGSSANEPVALSPTGDWTGANGNATITLSLSTSGGTVTGSAQFAQGATPKALNVAGTFSGSSITLSMSTQNFPTMTFAGNVTASQMIGAMNGNGYSNTTWSFARK